MGGGGGDAPPARRDFQGVSTLKAFAVSRRLPILGLAGVLLAAGCQESVTAPGACPAFCPPETVRVIDSLLLQNIVSDSSFAGYVAPHGAGGLELINDPGGTALVTTSRAVVRFPEFAERLVLSSSDTTTGLVARIDSFAIDVPIQRRSIGVSGLELVLHRLPVSVDSLTGYAELDSAFVDATQFGVIAIPDSLAVGTVRAVVPAAAFPTFNDDTRRAAFGMRLRSATPAFVTVGSVEGGAAVQLTRYAKVDDNAGGRVALSDARSPTLDTFLAPATPAAGAGIRTVGGVPSARTLVRIDLPSRIIESGEVVRATLLLVPTEPVAGAPGDSVRLVAQALASDVGPKSPLVVIPVDSVAKRATAARVGSVDTIRIDVTDVFRRWGADDSLPRILALRAFPEGASFGRIRFGSTGTGGARPILRVTFIPSLRLGGSP